MNGFEKLMRNVGLMIHHARKPDGGEDGGRTEELRRETEEKRHGDGVVLRRTMIDEIEIKQPRPRPHTRATTE